MSDNKDKGNSLTILWIEDQLAELKEGVEELERLIKAKPKWNEVHRVEALTVDAAEKTLGELKDNPPDLIILDIMLSRTEETRKARLPRVDMNAGFFLWHRIRVLEEWGKAMTKVPIVVVTGRGNPEFRPKMEREDKNLKWLGKPVAPSEIAEAILSLFGKKQEEQASSDA